MSEIPLVQRRSKSITLLVIIILGLTHSSTWIFGYMANESNDITTTITTPIYITPPTNPTTTIPTTTTIIEEPVIVFDDQLTFIAISGSAVVNESEYNSIWDYMNMISERTSNTTLEWQYNSSRTYFMYFNALIFNGDMNVSIAPDPKWLDSKIEVYVADVGCYVEAIILDYMAMPEQSRFVAYPEKGNFYQFELTDYYHISVIFLGYYENDSEGFSQLLDFFVGYVFVRSLELS